jgi:signal transduction histidine kinase
MAQVLGNLLGNALRHTAEGGTVRLTAVVAGDEVQLAVSDSGSGIAAADLPHIFDRFYRGDAARQQTGESGLGLAIARSIVEAHGGTIAVESAPGVGSTFTISLPAANPSLSFRTK